MKKSPRKADAHQTDALERTADPAQVGSALRKELRDLRGKVADLERQLATARAGSAESRDARRAALNLMEDAVAARRAEQTENAERRHVEEQLRIADRRKNEFLATLAHELRNPLAPIRSSLYILKLSDAGGEQTRAVYEMLERQVTHLVRLVDDLMEISRITRGEITLRPERVYLASVVRNAIEFSKPLIETAGHELVVNLPEDAVMIEADPVRLAQVIANLLNNAAKYTEPGGRVELEAYRDESAVKICVRDSGLGIPPEMLSHIFDLFVQVDHTLGRAQGGLGIGLTLVRTLVAAHGGTVEAKSEGSGRGSEFVVRLPIEEPEAATARLRKPPSSAVFHAETSPFI